MDLTGPPSGTKFCKRCQRTKPLEAFGRASASPDGHQWWCNECRKAYKAARANSARKAFNPPHTVAEVVATAHAEHHPATPDVPPAGAKQWPHLYAFEQHNYGVQADICNENTPPPKVVEETITEVEDHRLKRKLADAQAEVKRLIEELSDARAMGDFVREAQERPVAPITPREHSSGLREGTALVMASDWHIEEAVRPEQVAGRNRYNLDISAQRMERFFQATRWATEFSRQAFEVRDMVLWLGGDLITNYLHPDNVETNLLSPPQALAYAQASIVGGLRYLLQDPKLERLVVPCNDGNHGRMTEKMRSASRTAMSLETMLYGMLSREFANEPRIQFVIAEGEHLYYDVYGRTIRFTHGDNVRYWGGVGGITIPLYKALARWQTIREAALTCCGHFHQRICLPDLMVNGSLIGYSPYSMSIGARFEAPSQNFSILEPGRFRSLDLPLHVAERGDDELAA